MKETTEVLPKYKTLQNNTSQFTFLAKDVGFKGTRNEGKFLFENMKNYLH